MNIRILLINPPYPIEESPSPPFGLMSLAAYIVREGCDVRIEDYIVNPYSIERVSRVIGEFDPHVIGSTGVTMNINQSLKILKDFADRKPDALTVLGGPHVTFDADNILKDNPFVDVIVRGEGEITFTELLQNLRNRNNFKNISGLSFRENNQIVHTPSREFIKDINILPFPARHLVQHSKYRAMGFPVNMVTSRGCPFECIFCVGSHMVGRKVRYFDVSRVVDEFEMISKLDFSQINIVDDLFTSHRKRCIAICDEIIRRGINHPWTAFARVDTISRELLTALKGAGCTTLCFGIESGSQKILDTVKKKTNLAMCRKAIKLCYESGIEPMSSYILGLPGETPETVKETLKLSRKLCSSYGYHILAPFPGTEVREKCDEYGIRILTDDWDRYDANQSVCESVHMPHEEVDKIVNEFNSGIHRYVLSELKKFENGESLTPDSAAMVNKFKSFDFSYSLINNNLVESFAESECGNGSGINDFIEYIVKKTDYAQERVLGEVQRLLDLNCISLNNDSKACLSWT